MTYYSKYGIKFIRYNLLLLLIPTIIIVLVGYLRDIPPSRISVSIILIIIIVLVNTFKPVKYTFTNHQLIIYNGFKKSKIFYDAITNVSATDDIIVGGNKAAKSEDAIQIDYIGGVYDNVKVSPKEKEEFLRELKKKAVKAKFNI